MKYFFPFIISMTILANCSFDKSGLPEDTNNSNNNNNLSCGNGTIEGDESCDGTNLNEAKCSDLGFTSGYPGCKSDCTFDLSLCRDFCGECQPGWGKCFNNNIYQCMDDGNGCGNWQLSQNCSEEGKFCHQNDHSAFCSTSCTNQCSLDAPSFCSDDHSALVTCTEISINSVKCNVNTIDYECDTNQICTVINEEFQCIDYCQNICTAGEEKCSPNNNIKLICIENQNGCTYWEESPCPPSTICKMEEENAICSCQICDTGNTRCNLDQTEVMECREISEDCTDWVSAETCEIEEYYYCDPQSSEQASCQKLGNYCEHPIPLSSTNFQFSSPNFTTEFTNEFNFSHQESCGTNLGGASDLFLNASLYQGQSLKISKGSGLDIAIRIIESCSENTICLKASTENELVFTPFQSGNYTIVIENFGTLPEEESLTVNIEPVNNKCTAFESEPNNLQNSNSFSGTLGTWCSQIIPPEDIDCFQILLPNDGDILTISTTDILQGNLCPGDTALQIFDSNNNLIANNNDAAADNYCSLLSPRLQPELFNLPSDLYTVCTSHYDNSSIIPEVATNVKINQNSTEIMENNFDNCDLSDWENYSIPENAGSWQCNGSGDVTMKISSTLLTEADYVLRTPTLDFSGFNHVFAYFEQRMENNNSGGQTSANLKVEDGTQTTVPYSNFSTITSFTPIVVDLSEQAGKNQINLSFVFSVPSVATSGYWEINNLHIIGY
ncbi:MAG: hypothetical protein ACQES9_08370 [Myxococcota bacterium]